MKFEFLSTVKKEMEISAKLAKILEEKVEELKKTPIENHNNSWEYDDFESLSHNEQLMVAFEELGCTGPDEMYDEELLHWWIED